MISKGDFDFGRLTHSPGCWKEVGHRLCAVEMLLEVWAALSQPDDSAVAYHVRQVFASRLERQA